MKSTECEYPLCVATQQPVCCAVVEQSLRESMLPSEIVAAKKSIGLHATGPETNMLYEEINRNIDIKLLSNVELTPEDIFTYTRIQDLPNEIWRDVAGYEGWYQVSNLGRVKSLARSMQGCGGATLKNDKIMVLHEYNKYAQCRLAKYGKKYPVLIHRLVAEAFIPKTDEDIRLGRDAVNHIDGNRINNRVSNLEWCTYKENSQHALATGLKPVKVTRDMAARMVDLYNKGLMIRDIQKLYYPQLSSTVINNVVYGYGYEFLGDLDRPVTRNKRNPDDIHKSTTKITHDILVHMVELYMQGVPLIDIHSVYYPNIDRTTIRDAIFRRTFTHWTDIPIPSVLNKKVLCSFDHPRCKLTLENVLEIRLRRAHGMTYASIGKILGVDRTTVSNVIKNKHFSDVKLEDYPELVEQIKARLGYE